MLWSSVIILLLLLICLVYLMTTREGYWNVYNMPGIPKTYITPHYVLNQSCYQNADA